MCVFSLTQFVNAQQARRVGRQRRRHRGQRRRRQPRVHRRQQLLTVHSSLGNRLCTVVQFSTPLCAPSVSSVSSVGISGLRRAT